MHDLAIVSRIQDIKPIEGKDRIVLATIQNYNSIIQKDTFNVGDLCIYIFYDSILPVRPEFEFLRKHCFSEKLNGFRIRPMKMGSVVSEGLVLSLSILPKGDYREGDNVTDILGIRLYETAEDPVSISNSKWWYRFKFLRKLFFKKPIVNGYPVNIPKSDETNIEKCWESVKDIEESFIITEKIEGCASSYIYDKKKNELLIYSNNIEVGYTGCWGEVAKQYDLYNKLKNYYKKYKVQLCLQGEIAGNGIQKNIYKIDGYKWFIYGGYDYKTGRKLAFSEILDICEELDLPIVPLLGKGHITDDIERMLNQSENSSVVRPSIPREGVVWRTDKGDIHFKVKSREYKVWFDSYKG